MEDFSQSRGDDNLFDDEIVPIELSSEAPVEEVTQKLEQVSFSPPANTTSAPSPQQIPTQRGRGRGRGAPIRGAPSRQRGLADSRFAPQAQPQPPSAPVEIAIAQETTTSPSAGTASSEPPNSAPTAPATKPRPPAVRGDRSATGGFTRPKLSEDELTAKLAAAKAKSQETAAAHARAQADKDSFDARERVARERREKEEKRKKELEGERESNRRRKMDAGAVGGREWDREKVDLGTESRWEERARERDRFRDEKEDLREYVWDEGRGRGGGRGRGRGRGDRGGRGRRGARGEFATGANAQQQPVDINATELFPALPGGAAAPKPEEKQSAGWAVSKSATTDAAQATGSTSWADQVEVEADKAK